MRITYLKLVGYIGIYNGLGLNEIEIDFSKSKFKKVVIRGANGSGKSTLIKALNIMPDNNSSLIPTMECRKEISILNKGILYNIQIIHPLNSKGERATSKGYIQKSSPNGMIELNPNGNISGYKEIVYSELNLDPNFIALSQLGSENKGLASLRPAERKKFVNSIIGDISAYNDMNKTFTKKANIYKSMRNSILTKIDNLGNIDKLQLALSNANLKYDKLNGEKDVIMTEISSEKAKIALLDKDGTIRDKSTSIANEVKIINNKLEETKRNLSTCKVEIDKANIDAFYKSLSERKIELDMAIKVDQSKVNSLLLDRENDAKQLQSISGKLKALQGDNLTKDNLLNLISESNIKIDNYTKMIANMKIKDINNISKDEFIIALDTLHDIEETINNLRINYTYDAICHSVLEIQGKEYIDEISLEKEIYSHESFIDDLKEKIYFYNSKINILSTLNNRPKECKNDKCAFITDALNIQKEYPNIYQDLSNMEKQLKEEQIKLEELKNTKQLKQEINKCSRDINNVVRQIDRNCNVIRKLVVDERFLNSNRILEIIEDTNIFKEINIIYSYINETNVIELYKNEIEQLKYYKTQLNIVEEKEDITNSIIDQMNYIQDKLNSTSEEIKTLNNNIVSYKKNLSDINTILLEVEFLKNMYDTEDELSSKKESLLNEFKNIQESMLEIKQSIDRVSELTNKLTNINQELTPLNDTRDKLKHSIKLHEEYQQELKEYNDKYELIETLKKFSSPTSGIQTIFINLYMNKTLSLANQLLQLMFNGKYVLCQFVINDHEFRLPCVGSGLINDDISSMSLSERCMIGMIISFAILQQASTDYNILILDEIDGGLDSDNRVTFLTVLEQMISMLNVEQCFIISHNDEINLNDCDIIQLRANNQYNNIGGNVIYKY